jgi:excisionase family DNA binding protein
MITLTCSGLRPMSEPWISVDEVSHYLGVAKDTTYRWIEIRGLPAHRVGGLWKVKIEELDGRVHRGGASDRDPSDEGRR